MDDFNRLWDEMHTMESRITGRLDRMQLDMAERHADNINRLAKLEQFYWQSVGAGKLSRALWMAVTAVLTSAIWWIRGYFK